QFAQDNDIGWFRAWYNKKTGEVHVLEVQSDLFQKGRDKEDLQDRVETVTYKGKQYHIIAEGENSYFLSSVESTGIAYTTPEDIDFDDEGKPYQSGGEDIPSFEEIEVPKSEIKSTNKQKNQFLQLLNKDNNWVTFFVKSIIQDSAKKGYEKVLFPTGNTASKVEGHNTLEEFKKQKEDRIKELEKDKELLNDILKKENYRDDGNSFVDNRAVKIPLRYNTISGGKTFEEVKQATLNKVDNEINQVKQELERVEKEGFGALKPIYNFYENTVANILKKQGYNPVLITDEYGNQWREITINQARDLADILLQRNEANQIIGQANIKALTVLIDAINQKQDTLPHEYAHHYIAWYRNTPIVQEAIKKWGSEEALVQSIGEQVIKQKGEAYNWWNTFVKWIMNQFNSLSKLQKEELTQILTDAFLTRQDLNNIGNNSFQQFQQSLNKPNTNPILQGNQTNVEEIITQLEKDGLLEIDCKGKLKAEKGLVTSFVKGGKWKVIKDLKGYPTHKEGGVDLTIGKNGVTIKNGNTQFTAKHGLVIPKAQNGLVIPEKGKNDYAGGGTLIEKIKGSNLNPKNWGVTDYSDRKDFNTAYSDARNKGEKEFLFKGNRYNTDYKGTPQQQLKETGITNDRLGIKTDRSDKAYNYVKPSVYLSKEDVNQQLKNYFNSKNRFDNTEINKLRKEYIEES
ncbi:MAG TPA: hypothetical protein PKI46_05030, partial [Bacteroidales bacterium]|nr:hypothetical protein [Bacteroidales bacterium]